MLSTLKKRRAIPKLPDFPTLKKGTTRESGTLYQMEKDNWIQIIIPMLVNIKLSDIPLESVQQILYGFGVHYLGDEKTLRNRLEEMLLFVSVPRFEYYGSRWDEPKYITFQNVEDQVPCGRLLRQKDVCKVIFKSLDTKKLILCLRVCKWFYFYAHKVLCERARERFGVFGTPIYFSFLQKISTPDRYQWLRNWEYFGYLDHLSSYNREFKEKCEAFNTFLSNNGFSYFELNKKNEFDEFLWKFFTKGFSVHLEQFFNLNKAWDANTLKNLMERMYKKGQKIPFSHCGPFFSGLVYLSKNGYHCGKNFTTPNEFPLGDDVFAVFFEKKLFFIKICSDDENDCKVQILEQIKGKYIKKINMQKGNRFAIVTKY
jgi:hypothetical protein